MQNASGSGLCPRQSAITDVFHSIINLTLKVIYTSIMMKQSSNQTS